MKKIMAIRSVCYLINGVMLLASSIALGDQTEQLKRNPYGMVVDQNSEMIKNALVQQVNIFSPQDDQATSHLVRKGVVVRYDQAEATILICHGFMCDKFDVAFLRHLFPPGKFNFMTFDLRAHGEDVQGQYCTFGKDEALDVVAAARFLRSDPILNKKPLFVYGFSMGAAAAIEAQAKEKLFDAMILDCPFDSTENVLKNCLDKLKISFFGYQCALPFRSVLEKYIFHPYVQSFVRVLLKTVAHLDPKNIQTLIYPIKPVESIRKVSVPCFFIHCKNDEKIPIDSIKNIFNNAECYKKLWLTNGRRHFDSFFYNPERYVAKIVTFLDQVLHGNLYAKEHGQIVEDGQEKQSSGSLFIDDLWKYGLWKE